MNGPGFPRKRPDMRKAPTMIVLEFNELTPALLERFMALGKLPNFSKLYGSSTIYTTDAAEEPPHLEPWIQWPTIHTGTPRSEHGAFHLGDGRNIAAKGFGQVLSEAGVRVGIFGSMNTNYGSLNGYLVPDPWDAKARPFPASLKPFTSFVGKQVQESSHDAAGIGRAAAVAFLTFLATHGLSLKAVAAVARQLLAEQRDASVRWRRAMLLDAISYDVFRFLNRRYAVDFATFFSNCVAHFQHYHWRDMEPEIFEHALEADAAPSHARAIFEGYLSNDVLLGRVLRDYPNSTIVFCTALSQQPWRDTAKCAYRPLDFTTFLRFAGFDPKVRVEPVMAEEFRLSGGDPGPIAERLRTLTIDGKPLMKSDIIEGAVHTGAMLFDGAAEVLERTVLGPSGRTARFGSLFYRLPSMRSGRHHPDGALWIRDGAPHRVHAGRISLESIAPTILDRFGVAVPPHMAMGRLARRDEAFAQPAVADDSRERAIAASL